VALPGTAEAVSLGGAILGATAAGLYGAVEEAAAAMGRVQETTQPDPAEQAVYKREYGVYMDLMRTLTPAFIKAFRNQ
jgi:ribulose kinase